MEPIRITINPGGQYIEEVPHEGEEFGYVLSDSIMLYKQKVLVLQNKIIPRTSTFYKSNILFKYILLELIDN